MTRHRITGLPLALAALCAAVLLIVGAPRAEDRSAEAQALAEAFRSNSMANRIAALKKVTNSGLTDSALFEAIRARLADDYRVDPSNDKAVDEVSWMCKALASSGNPEYKELLGKVAADAPSEKVRNYAQQSRGLVDEYAERNAQLAKRSAETEGLTPEVARLVNMLRAPDFRLKKDAAKMITRGNYREPRLYAVVSDELVTGTRAGGVDKDKADMLAWLCKALAASGDAQYRATLEEIYRDAPHDTLRKYARQSADMLQ